MQPKAAFLQVEDEVLRKTTVKRVSAQSLRRRPAGTAKQQMQALGRLKQGAKNKTETAYGHHLQLLLTAGEILWYRFEGIKLRLADKTFYTADYNVMRADGLLEMHEVKGVWTDDARVKIKVAADQYPFRFIAVKKSKGGWEYEYFD